MRVIGFYSVCNGVALMAKIKHKNDCLGYIGELDWEKTQVYLEAWAVMHKMRAKL